MTMTVSISQKIGGKAVVLRNVGPGQLNRLYKLAAALGVTVTIWMIPGGKRDAEPSD